MTRHLGAAALAVAVISVLSPAGSSHAQDVQRTHRPSAGERATAQTSPYASAAAAGTGDADGAANARTDGTVAFQPQIGGRWPGTRITFSDRLPRSYNWAIRNAVRAWNQGSGTAVTFVRAPRGERGQVVFKRAATGGSAGRATLGYTPGAWVHLDRSSYGKRLERGRWIMTSVLLAHELGHVLGLEHSRNPAHLMHPYVPYHHRVGPNTMTCQGVTRGDARRAVELYGGEVALRPRRCAIS